MPQTQRDIAIAFARPVRGRRIVLACVSLAICLAATTASAQTTLKFATTMPGTNPLVSQFWEPWAKRVNEAAGSEFQIQVVNGPTIANAVNVWGRVADGLPTSVGAIMAP